MSTWIENEQPDNNSDIILVLQIKKKMREASFAFAIIAFFSCNIKDKPSIKTGKYFAAHGFQNEYIIVTNDSSYTLYVGDRFIKSASWKFLPEKSKLCFSNFIQLVDWETGSIKTNPNTSSKLFNYRTVGILSGGFEKLDYIHETLWDTAKHRMK